MQAWPGRYLDGVTAHPESVTVTPAAHGLEIRRADGSLMVWRYLDVRQTQGNYHGEQVRLERGTKTVEALVVDDTAFLSRLHRIAPRVSGRFHDPTSRSRRPFLVAAAFVVAIVLSIGIYFWGIPATATFLAEQVPVSWEEELGRTVTESFIGSEPVCADTRVAAAVNDMVQRLAATVPDSPYKFRVTVVQHDQINAFAAPGGHIVVFSGLLERTTRPEELAGVLAHEMNHVIHRHGTKSVFRDVSTSIFFAVLLGDFGGAMGIVLESAKTLGALDYSRQAENEADRDGLSMLKLARIDPAGMVSFFEKLETQVGSKEPELFRYISTHPLTRDRIAKLRAEIGTPAEKFISLYSAKRWKDIAAACKH